MRSCLAAKTVNGLTLRQGNVKMFVHCCRCRHRIQGGPVLRQIRGGGVVLCDATPAARPPHRVGSVQLGENEPQA